jgi:hypothetical protein
VRTREFLTFWFEFLTFLRGRANISLFGLNFSFFLRGRANFSLFDLNFSLFLRGCANFSLFKRHGLAAIPIPIPLTFTEILTNYYYNRQA